VRKLLGTFWGTQWELEEHNENFVRTLWEQQKSNTQKLPLCSSKGCMLPHLIRWKKVFSLIYVLCHFWPTPMAYANGKGMNNYGCVWREVNFGGHMFPLKVVDRITQIWHNMSSHQV